MLQSVFRLKETMWDHVPSSDVWLSRLISQTLKGYRSLYRRGETTDPCFYGNSEQRDFYMS